MSDPQFNPVIKKDGTIDYVRSDYDDAVKKGRLSARNPSFVPGPEFLENLPEILSKQYQNQRQPEYPPVVDFIDAYYWLVKGDNTKMDAYISKVEEVKSKYPKPEGA